MMDMNTAANIAEIAGGIAILFSLIYAGFQIRQSNRIAKAESVRSMMSSDFLDQYNMANVGRALNNFDSLDFDAKWEFHSYFMRLFANYHMVAQTRNLGLIQDTYLDEWSRVVAATLATVGATLTAISNIRRDNIFSVVPGSSQYAAHKWHIFL